MKTIVWDVDDVLNDLMRDWFTRAWCPAHPHCAVRYEDIVENPPHRVLGITREKYLSSLDAFRLGAGLTMAPCGEVLGWFQRYGDCCRHVALTAVPLRAADISAMWVIRHFGRWIRSFNVVPSPRPDEALQTGDRTKKEFLEWWGKADVLIDDSLVNVSAARELGIEALLCPRPWNNEVGDLRRTLDALTLFACPGSV